jgi:hypothetical protein
VVAFHGVPPVVAGLIILFWLAVLLLVLTGLWKLCTWIVKRLQERSKHS